MALFDIKTQTTVGRNYLTQAVAGSKIIWDGIKVSTDYFSNPVGLADLTKIVITSPVDYAEQVSNEQFDIGGHVDSSKVHSDTIIKTWGLYGHVGSDNSQLLAVLSSQSGQTLYANTRDVQTIKETFSLVFPNPSNTPISFVVSNSGFALDDNVVHTTGDETARGVKNFQDGVKSGGKNVVTQNGDDTINVANGLTNNVIEPVDRSKIKDSIIQASLSSSNNIDNLENDGRYPFDSVTIVKIDPNNKISGYLDQSTNGSTIIQGTVYTVGTTKYVKYRSKSNGAWSDWNTSASIADMEVKLANKVNVADMRKPASDVAGIEEVNAKQDKIGYMPADDSKVVHTADTSNWQKHKLTADDGSAKLVIASGEDVNEKLKAIVGTKDTGKLLVDSSAENNPTGHSLIGEYFCDFDGLVTGYGIGQDEAMWKFTYNGTTTLWKLIITAKKPEIPKLAVKYKATNQSFEYTLTAPEKDGFSDIIQYNLLWKDHSVDDWTTVIVKPDSLTGQLTGVNIEKTYDFKASAQNAVGASGFTDVITLGTAAVPGIPSLVVEYNAGKKGFDYTVTAPESDGGSEITGYSLEYQKQRGTDWTKVALKPDRLTGTVTDGIEARSNYLFRVNAENSVGSSDYFTISHPVPAVDGSIYGASWDGSSSGILQRTDAAVGLKAGINGAQNDFDTRGPWGLMDKNVTDSYGNAFVRVPKFYIRKTQDKSNSLSTWQVSLAKQGTDWYLPNCFYDFDNKKELAYVDVSRYEGSVSSDKLQSISGATPTTRQSITSLRSLAVANNADGKKGYHLWDVHTLDALQVLFTIEFATLDSQSIMEGNDAGSSAISNGTTDNVKGSSGFAASGAAPMTYRGIENLYGNLAMWTDGLNITNLSLYSCDDAAKYVSDAFTDPYYMLNYSLPASDSGNTNITSLGFDKDHPSVEAPTSYNSDNYNTYYHDEEYTTNSGNYVVCTGGGRAWDAGGSGLWYWYSNYSSTYAASNVGSRLLKKAL